MRVLDDNIEACRAVQYQNKTKILEYLKSICEKSLGIGGDESLGAESVIEREGDSGGSTSYHAPQFLDHTSDKAGPSTVLTPEVFPTRTSKSTSGLSKAKAKVLYSCYTFSVI